MRLLQQFFVGISYDIDMLGANLISFLENQPQSLACIGPFFLDISVNLSGPFATSGKAEVVKGTQLHKIKTREHIL